MELTFDKETHTYFCDNIKCVSVTTVLQELGFIDLSGIPQDVLDYAALRGTYTHKAIELYLQGKLNEDTLDPAIQPYFQGFKKFASKHELKPLHLEKMFAIKHLLIAGTVDFIGEVDGKLTLADWKTSSVVTKAVALQIGGYLLLANHEVKEPESLIENAMVVQLKKNDYSLMPQQWLEDVDSKFQCILETYWLRKGIKGV